MYIYSWKNAILLAKLSIDYILCLVLWPTLRDLNLLFDIMLLSWAVNRMNNFYFPNNDLVIDWLSDNLWRSNYMACGFCILLFFVPYIIKEFWLFLCFPSLDQLTLWKLSNLFDAIHNVALPQMTSNAVFELAIITKKICHPGTDLEWKLIYVGSAEDETYDQLLESVLVGPVNVGNYRFVLQVPAV